MFRSPLAALALVLIASCGNGPTPSPGSTAGPASAPRATASAAASVPAPPALAPGSRAAVRENLSRGPWKDGFALELRALRSRVTAQDGLGIALRLLAEKGMDGPWSAESVDWAAARASLRAQVKGPDGTVRSLARPRERAGTLAWTLGSLQKVLSVDGAALVDGEERLPWTEEARDLLAAPGPREVTLSLTLTTSARTLELTSGPLRIDVVAPSSEALALVDLERNASAAARRIWEAEGIPLPTDPTVDHEDGSLSVRFRKKDGGTGRTGYELELLEVWLDPAGKELAVDGYQHFACVAEGTRVATPTGSVPIEGLAIGAEVLAFDVEAGRRAVARVERVDVAFAEDLVSLGELAATAEHPVWADGAWTPAGRVREGARLVTAEGAVRLARPAPLGRAGRVFDVTVTAPHTFFAGGVLVHNKAAHVPLGGDRPWGPLFYRRAAAR